jgi:hypothetical protein
MVTETYNAEPKVILTLTSQGIEALRNKIITVILDEKEHVYEIEDYLTRLGIAD